MFSQCSTLLDSEECYKLIHKSRVITATAPSSLVWKPRPKLALDVDEDIIFTLGYGDSRSCSCVAERPEPVSISD
jgi:hypothetical protein